MFTKIKNAYVLVYERDKFYNMETIQKLQEEIDLGLVFIIYYILE